VDHNSGSLEDSAEAPLARAFPFYLELDEQLCIASHGHRYRQLAPEMRLGDSIEKHFVLERPDAPFCTEVLVGRPDDAFILQLKAGTKLRLRGQFLSTKKQSAQCLSFLGVPWITSLPELEEHGLDLSDFPPHSAVGELLVLMQIKDSGYEEARKMASDLRDATRELALRNEALEKEIQERERLEEQLRQSQKMEALGQLAGGVAHDFNNILLAITGHASLGNESARSSEARQHFEKIISAAEQAGDLTRRLLTFGRRKMLTDRVVNVDKALGEAVSMLNRVMHENIDLNWECAPDAGAISVDSTAFQQVLMNLAINARDAMPNGGTLTLAAQRERVREARLLTSGELLPGDWVEVSVQDTGGGIDPEIAHRIFEPFFTTKSEHGGFGLGLATVWWVLEHSQGQLDLTSSSTGGTTFRIYLPSVRPEVASPEAGQTDEAPARSSARILLVEDNHDVRKLVERILSGAGYEVTPAEHADHALRLVEQCGHPFDMLLTDLVMPGMHGTELAEKMRQLEPGLPVIFMSGYDRRSVSGMDENGAPMTLLSKPFKPAALLDCIQRKLNSA